MANWKNVAEEILANLGGKENVIYLGHCITRLRFTLKDNSKVNKKAIQEIDGVLGFAEQGDQQQVIIGPAVEKAFEEMTKLVGDSVNVDKVQINENLDEGKKKWSIKTAVDTLTAILSPTIPAFCAAGMLKVILLLLTTVGIATGEEGAYLLFSMIADTAFYFLPIIVAVSAGKRFNVDMGLSVMVGASLIYPDFVTLVTEGGALSFFGINVPLYKYSATIFPALLGVWLLSYVYKFVNKLIKWDSLKSLLVPMLSIVITLPIVYLFVAPIADTACVYLTLAFKWLMDTAGPIAGFVIGCLMPLMTLTGLHRSLSPLEMMEMTTFGYSQFLSIELYHNFAESGSALGTAFFTKDKKFKTVAAETGVQAFIGVSEPALYAVMVRERASMLAAMVGNGLGGMVGITLGAKQFAYVWPNVFALPSYIGTLGMKGLIYAVIASVVAFVSSFLLVPVMNKILKTK
ncbi:MAG: PTS transporter subunit EIIC [Holdemanella sp.]|nr:PTS transporter subunit EIIC [Holdemanella sp.]